MSQNLSPLETFYAEQSMSIVTVSDLVGTVNALILQKAIVLGVGLYPFLVSQIESSEEGLAFVPYVLDEEKMKMIGAVDKLKRKEVILSELNTPLDATRLVRWTLLLEERIGMLKPQAISLVMTVHRAVCDIQKAVALQEHIWRIYTELVAQHEPEVEPLPFSENVSMTSLDDYMAAAKKAEEEENIEIAYVRKKFTIKQTHTILAKCKQQDISLYEAIVAVHLPQNKGCAMSVADLGEIKSQAITRKLKLSALQAIACIPLPLLHICFIVTGNKLTITYPYAKPFYSTNQIKKIADLSAALF